MCVNNHVHWFYVLSSCKLWPRIYLSDKSFVQNAQAADLRLSLNSWYWQVYFISFGSFNDTISDCMALSEVWLANSELDRMWKELVVVWFEASGICLDRVQSWKPSIRVVQSLSWDLNIEHTKHEAGMLDTQPWHFWLTVQDDCQQIWMFILSPEGLPLGAVWSFNRQIWQCLPIKYTSLLSKRENVPQWEFKLNSVPAAAYILHLKGCVLKVNILSHITIQQLELWNVQYSEWLSEVDRELHRICTSQIIQPVISLVSIDWYGNTVWYSSR